MKTKAETKITKNGGLVARLAEHDYIGMDDEARLVEAAATGREWDHATVRTYAEGDRSELSDYPGVFSLTPQSAARRA